MSEETLASLSHPLDLDALARMVAEGWIIERTNSAGYRLYNYAAKAQYEWFWNAETLACRGIVLAPDGAVQSRPFAKFFNLDEHATGRIPPLPVEPFTVQEKLDGSLIVASRLDDGTNLVTSRGSFDSPHAAEGAAFLDRYGIEVPEGETWCMELIAPWNRIVVDYGDRNELVMLARFDSASGDELDPDTGLLNVARTFDGIEDVDEISERLAALGPNEEGFVLRFASGARAKAKGDEYKRLHKLLTGVTPRTIWECLANGSGLGTIVDRVPDEFHQWAKGVAADLQSQHDDVLAMAEVEHAKVLEFPTRKDQALAIAGFPHKSVVFALLDGKPHSPIIWKGLRPPPARAFAMDADAPSDNGRSTTD